MKLERLKMRSKKKQIKKLQTNLKPSKMNWKNLEKHLKKRIPVLMLLIVPLFMSCRTVKSSLEQKTNTTSVIQNAITEHVQTIDTTRKTDSIITKITDTYFSKPDSVGHQYITHVATTQKKQVSKTQNAITQAITKTDNSTAKSKASIQTKQTVKQQTKTSSFFVILAWIIGVGVVIAVFFILKRFGIIKL